MNQDEKYISWEEFVQKTGHSERTVKKHYKEIPGISQTEQGFLVLRGTRYPYYDYKRFRFSVDDFGKKRYALLKAISRNEYISYRELRLEERQFTDMLRELLESGLIRPNHLFNTYGANAYDITQDGDEALELERNKAIKNIAEIVASAAGTFVGKMISQIQ